MSELAQTACSRCRDQKLRCSREQPKCERCLRLGAKCIFPEPPDRKKLASLRASARKRKAEGDLPHPPNTGTSVFALRSPPSSASKSPYEISSTAPESAVLTTETHKDIHIPGPVQGALQIVYFTCIFNSSLLFHQEEFARSIRNGGIPRHTLLAIYALASNFIFPGTVSYNNHAAVFSNAGDLRSQGGEWATAAGKEVLQTIDTPNLNSIRTCQTLALYWFSQGEAHRNAMFSGITRRATRVLRLDTEGNDFNLSDRIGGQTSSTPWLHCEIVRRCMWASWLSNMINSDHYVVGGSVDPRMLAMPLPINEEAYDGKVEQPHTTLADVRQASEEGGKASVIALLFRLVLIWAKVRDYIETRKDSNQSKILTNLFNLDAQLSHWRKNLPSRLAYSKKNLREQLVVMRQPCYTLLHVLYHQCRLVLHASLVPQFSGIASQDATPPEAVQMSAQVALKSAQAVSDIASDFLELAWDPAQLAPFLGYTMYTAATVHLPFVVSTDQRLRDKARKHLTANLKLLKTMKPFWKNLEKLWARIHLLYEVQTSKVQAVVYGGEDAYSTDGDGIGGELGRVAANKRDSGRLAEPLADSVLDYGLRRLSQKIVIDEMSPSAQELEMVIRPEVQQQPPTSSPQYFDATPNNQALQPQGDMASMPSSLDAAAIMADYQPAIGPDLQDLYGSLKDSSFPGIDLSQLDGGGAAGVGISDWWQYDLNDFSAAMPWQDVFNTANLT